MTFEVIFRVKTLMTSAQVVEMSVNVISNSPSQDYTHPDDRTLLNDITPGFKPFTTFMFVVDIAEGPSDERQRVFFWQLVFWT